MRILIVNDDGIASMGLRKLAEAARHFGSVTVVAPKEQCSAMSHRITIRKDLRLVKVVFPVPEVEAYHLSGTPADCVKTAVRYVMKEKPDYVFSGINNGYNVGFDIAYSGTVAAAMEGLMNGIKAIAFSHSFFGDLSDEDFSVTDSYLLPIMEEIIACNKERDCVWNVNIPECGKQALKGILWDRKIASFQIFEDRFLSVGRQENEEIIREDGVRRDLRDTGTETDVGAVMGNYISIGKIKSSLIDISEFG